MILVAALIAAGSDARFAPSDRRLTAYAGQPLWSLYLRCAMAGSERLDRAGSAARDSADGFAYFWTAVSLQLQADRALSAKAAGDLLLSEADGLEPLRRRSQCRAIAAVTIRTQP